MRRSRVLARLVTALLAWSITAEIAAGRPAEPPTIAAAPFDEKPQEIAFARQQLVNVVKLFDRHFRVEPTGQYLDALDLDDARQADPQSSIAATGMGLIALVYGDILGVVEDADLKAEATLANLANRDTGAAFYTRRSPTGWYQHWIDARTGAALNDSHERFSTIDTTLLAIGASIAGRYFGDHARLHPTPAADHVARLAAELVQTTQWSRAIKSVEDGTIHALLIGPDEKPYPDYVSRPFDEYVLVPCLGRSVEQARGISGPATLYWERNLSDVDRLPVKAYDGVNVLATVGHDYVSHFAPEFAFYFCRELREDPKFQRALSNLRDADQRWFQTSSNNLYPSRWWGLGAGSVVPLDGAVKDGPGRGEYYEATTLDPNDHHVFSPAIMAGFAPLDVLGIRTAGKTRHPTWIVDDLMSLYDHKECVYDYQTLTFLWRCSPMNVRRRTRYVQAIDLSTYMLGLASLLPEIGLDFYDRYAP